VRQAFVLAAGGALVAGLSFGGLVMQLGGVGGPVVANPGREQLEMTARLAREVALQSTSTPTASRAASLAQPTPLALPTQPSQSAQPSLEGKLGTAYDDLRRQLDYCQSGQASQVVAKLRPGAYDAVFGLGAGVLDAPTERPTALGGDDNRTRALGAFLAVAHFGAAPVLGFSGGFTGAPGAPSEAAAMERFVRSPAFQAAYRGTIATNPPTSFVLEERSTTTAENVAEIAALAKQRGWRRVLIVTSQYHTARTGQLVQAKALAADVVPAEALVDGALKDGAVHDGFCAFYASPPGQQAVQKEIVAIAELRAHG